MILLTDSIPCDSPLHTSDAGRQLRGLHPWDILQHQHLPSAFGKQIPVAYGLKGKTGADVKKQSRLTYSVLLPPLNLHFVGISCCISFLFAGSWAPPAKEKESEAAEMERPKIQKLTKPLGLRDFVFSPRLIPKFKDVVTLENYGKLTF